MTPVPELVTYSGGLTGHVAWRFGRAYVSLGPNKSLLQLAGIGSGVLPLPAGQQKAALKVWNPKWASEAEDSAAYGAANIVPITGLLRQAMGLFAVDFIRQCLPYNLWDPNKIVGTVNCVKVSSLIFFLGLPSEEYWPIHWKTNWKPFLPQRSQANWVFDFCNDLISPLQHVHQVSNMCTEWDSAWRAQYKNIGCIRPKNPHHV